MPSFVGKDKSSVNGDEKETEENKEVEQQQQQDEPNVELEEGEIDDYYYDKTKSFFDNISCEATERAKG